MATSRRPLVGGAPDTPVMRQPMCSAMRVHISGHLPRSNVTGNVKLQIGYRVRQSGARKDDLLSDLQIQRPNHFCHPGEAGGSVLRGFVLLDLLLFESEPAGQIRVKEAERALSEVA